MESFPKKIIFIPDALSEAREAYDWYESREKGLGEDFYRALSSTLTFAARNPGAYDNVQEGWEGSNGFPFDLKLLIFEHGHRAALEWTQ